ncbi:T-complex protein 1 subunit gamma [Oryzias melastigma]|uniref:T-complex protein 1 subunit gamma n=1 Tax=Oryzias melastigma TaxID=30732 RepID=A0A834L1E1_ORYME|nr:T-complex protein 1 subunit gamma [Oryzias melastigma]
MMGQQVLVLNQNVKRESGRKVQTGNISAAKMIADVIRTCLGPRAMMKMLLDPTGGIVMTNDGNAILREIQVQHPAAKSMIEISRTQDEEVGDGTTSVIILAGEMLSVAEQFLEQQMHPTVIISAYRQALEDMLEALKEVSTPVDTSDRSMMLKIINSAINTKALSRWSDLACTIALDAVRTVEMEDNGRKEIDIKKYAKVEKVPGGIIEDSCVLKGVMINKDVTHPRMKRMIKNPRIVLLDCSLEYKKGESQTDIEISKEEDFARILQMEEDYIQQICEDVIRLKPDLVFTEKGISDLAQHYLVKANITCNSPCEEDRQQPHCQVLQFQTSILKACGARIVSRTDELREEDVGLGAGLFEVKKIGDEYFTFITECKDPKACTILLRGASKEILAEVERNLQDAMQVCRNVLLDPFLLPGGGAVEMAVSKRLTERSRALTGVEQWPYRAVAQALEAIPRTLIQNCGASTIRVLTSLRAKHTQEGNVNWGIDGETGSLTDMSTMGIWEPLAVKAQTYKTAVETAILLLRIDDIVSGHKKKDKDEQFGGQGADFVGGTKEYQRKLIVSVNPNATTLPPGGDLLHVRAVGNDDTLHFLFCSQGAPTLLIVHTNSSTSSVQVNWPQFLSRNVSGGLRVEPQSSIQYSIAVVFSRLLEYDDVNDTAKPDSGFFPPYELQNFKWTRLQLFGAAALVCGKTPEFGNGTLCLKLSVFDSDGRAESWPRLLHSSNSSQLEVWLDGITPQAPNSRFLLELQAVGGDFPLSRVDVRQFIDDEFTPSIFKVSEWVSPAAGGSDVLGYVQWKPVAYRQSSPALEDATPCRYSDPQSQDANATAASSALIRAFFSAHNCHGIERELRPGGRTVL